MPTTEYCWKVTCLSSYGYEDGVYFNEQDHASSVASRLDAQNAVGCAHSGCSSYHRAKVEMVVRTPNMQVYDWRGRPC